MLFYNMIEDRTPKDCKSCLKRFEAIIADLQRQIKIQAKEIKALKEQINKNSSNSNKPPSTDDPFKKQTKSLREKSGKNVGGQIGHKGSTLEKRSDPDKIIRHPVTKCSCCGDNLDKVSVKKIESRQVFDIPPVKVEVTEHQSEIKKCPNCGTHNKGEFPVGVVNPAQYGINIKAVSSWLKNSGFVSYERIAEFFKEALGIKLSQATLQGFDIETARKLGDFEISLRENLLKEKVLHVDESGLRIEGKLNWVHSLSSNNYTLYYPHKKRGYEAIKEMSVLPKYEGTLIHDAWASYWNLSCFHGLCNVHHLRELKWVYENENQEWADDFINLLLKIKEDKEKKFPLSRYKTDKYNFFYDYFIKKGYRENPLPKRKSKRQRGKQYRGKILCLLDRLKKHKDEVLLFMEEEEVPFGNNLAERDIRIVKVQQKVSGTFRSWSGTYAFCRIRSFISTVRKKGFSSFNAIIDALNGNSLIYMTE